MARPLLSRSRIVAAGVAVTAEFGLPALSLRAVARRVNTTSTRVQRLISTTELVEAVVAEIIVTVPPPPARGLWPRRLRRWAADTHEWLATYPGLARHLQVNRWDMPVVLDRCEKIASILTASGLSPIERAMAADTVMNYVLASADADESARVIGAELSFDRIADATDRWPLLGTVAAHGLERAADQFAFGLDLVMRGIQDRATTANRAN